MGRETVSTKLGEGEVEIFLKGIDECDGFGFFVEAWVLGWGRGVGSYDSSESSLSTTPRLRSCELERARAR